MAAAAALTFCAPAIANPNVKGWKTMDSMGCMLLRECTEDVIPIKNIKDLEDHFPSYDYSYVRDEFNEIVSVMDRIGIGVFLADHKYFPAMHRGVYHTVGNNFFLNSIYMNDPAVLMSVIRHEGWHAAQDCMAGTIDNSMIAVILDEDKIPFIWKEMAERTYPPSAVPWEQEAAWAGRTEGMTLKALQACADGPMWEAYEPTPLTRQYLVDKGYLREP